MSREEILFDAITGIREDLIEWAQDYRFQRRAAPWRRYLAAAACLVLVTALGLGALRLGLFGGMGGSSGSDMAAPESADTGTPEAGGSASPGEGNAGAVWPETFTATVLEVHEAYLLVEPAPGEAILASADRVEVPIGDLADLPAFAAGDTVSVTYAGAIQETCPARVTGVLAVALREPG